MLIPPPNFWLWKSQTITKLLEKNHVWEFNFKILENWKTSDYRELPTDVKVIEDQKQYQLTETNNWEKGIRCKQCGWISYSKWDIDHLYCHHCKIWYWR